MEDIEANEGSGGDSPFRVVSEMGLHNSAETSGTEGTIDLHDAVLSVCEEGNMHADEYSHIDSLMDREDIKLNIPNEEGYTAIGLAVDLGNKTCVRHMLRHSSHYRLYLDYYPGERESTVRELIMQKYPDLEPLLPAPIMESLDSSDSNKRLLAALQHDEYDMFCENINPTNPNPRYDEPYHATVLEIACQMKNRTQFVTHLLKNGADPNTRNSITGMPLLHATARSGNFEVLEILLKKEGITLDVKDREDKTILHWLAWVSERAEGDKETIERCFKHLLQDSSDVLSAFIKEDKSGKSAASIAVEREFRDRIIILFDNQFDETISRYLIEPVLKQANKSFLEDILDYCFYSNNESVNDKNLKVQFKIPVLLILLDFILESRDKELKQLLRHPVATIFMNFMWNKVRYFFFLDVAFYIMFLLSLTAYILFYEFYSISSNSDVVKDTHAFLSSNDNQAMSDMDHDNLYNISQILWHILMVLLALLSIRELCQLLVYRLQYILWLENWLEVLLIGVTFTSCSGIVDSIEVRRHFFAIAIFLGWFELVLLLGRLPQLSVQIQMLKRVSLTFLKYMMGYIILLLAFAFSFYILFKGNVEVDDADMFSNPLISILKASVMFAGEFEASNLPFDTLPGTSHVIFLLYVFFVAIVLLNLLNGLAVGDTRKIREEAEKLSLEARTQSIDTIYNLYYAIPGFIIDSLELTEKILVLYPNETKKINSTDIRHLLRIITEKRKRIRKDKSVENIQNSKILLEKISTLQLQVDHTEIMLMRLLSHLNVPEP